MSKLTEFVLVPAVKIGAGRASGRLIEADIIHRYVQAFSDELETCAIRHRVSTLVYPQDFVIHCGLGWSNKPPSKQAADNTSRVYTASHEATEIAHELLEALTHWGQIYCCHGHRGSKPVVDSEDIVIGSGRGGLRLEPFIMNGPGADTYAQRLEFLGRDLGRALNDYIASGGHGGKRQVTTVGELPRLVRTL